MSKLYEKFLEVKNKKCTLGSCSPLFSRKSTLEFFCLTNLDYLCIINIGNEEPQTWFAD